MTALASANYSPIDLPMRNHLMVVCGMPYRYAVSVLCRCGLQCVVDMANGGGGERGDDNDDDDGE